MKRMDAKVQVTAKVNYNLPPSMLIEEALQRNEAVQTDAGALRFSRGFIRDVLLKINIS